jgi:hypothetical protein
VKRTILTITIALAAVLLPTAHRAWADDKPTPEQLDAAKKAFGEGKALHDQGKLPEAIEKFKESYRLSRNPVLLYNIALTLDENKQLDNALFYYRKFLSDAPADAAQRKTADERVKTLEKEKLEADLNGKPPTTGPETGPTGPTGPKPDTTPKVVKIKPAGTYGPNDFQHQVVEEVPPQKPLDISAFVPEDSGFTVTLFYRGAGDAIFVAKPMKWRYKELVARIPAAKITGSSIQYYIEVKDQAGTVVTRSGKSTSPNLINLTAGATPRFYPDMTDEGETKSPAETHHHDDEDPLNKNKQQAHDDDDITGNTNKSQPTPEVPSTPGQGFTDVGSTNFERAKWGSTITAGALVGLGVAFYVLASNQASALADDAKLPHGSCTAVPCPFDSYDRDLQSAGQRDQTISNVGIGFGVVASAVAGYFWYRQLTAKQHGDLKSAAKKPASPETTWVVAPSVTETFTGAAAAVRF